MTQQFDVVIVGGGMVGAVAACALARGGIKVALLETHEPPRSWPGEPADTRVSALTKATQNILEMLDAWPGMVERGVCPYRDMRVWDASGHGELHFDCAGTPFPQLGYLVENRVTVAALWDVLAGLPGAVAVVPAKVVAMTLTESAREIELDDGRRLQAGLVIAADGRDSKLRTMAGIGVTGWDYGQTSIVASVTTRQSHRFTAWQRFLPEGPLAFLPLHNGQCSIVWTLSTETANANLELSDEAFLVALTDASGGILGDMLAVGRRAGFPLRFQYANHYIAERFALVGDAAHAMHPLAGQGANAGFLDAAALAELLIAAQRGQRPLSSPKLLRQYERWRKGDNLAMMAGMDLLNKTYRLDSPLAVSLRSTGMNWVNHAEWVKSWFNHYAMGLRGDLPQLAKARPCW